MLLLLGFFLCKTFLKFVFLKTLDQTFSLYLPILLFNESQKGGYLSLFVTKLCTTTILYIMQANMLDDEYVYDAC